MSPMCQVLLVPPAAPCSPSRARDYRIISYHMCASSLGGKTYPSKETSMRFGASVREIFALSNFMLARFEQDKEPESVSKLWVLVDPKKLQLMVLSFIEGNNEAGPLLGDDKKPW
ncbi:unnamed protein product [Dovyalis caffra]|uniref:Uncharacterized protein n=1 Tax=Dovyalis caffra TaxID=77055 RepID=A0AAV1RI78_9ROSI|nr:unnamed protein product [Dovyalis caffra]